jgi:hypothetical protein
MLAEIIQKPTNFFNHFMQIEVCTKLNKKNLYLSIV